MSKPLKTKVRSDNEVIRHLRQLLCFRHDWYYLIKGEHRICRKCIKIEEVKK